MHNRIVLAPLNPPVTGADATRAAAAAAAATAETKRRERASPGCALHRIATIQPAAAPRKHVLPDGLCGAQSRTTDRHSTSLYSGAVWCLHSAVSTDNTHMTFSCMHLNSETHVTETSQNTLHASDDNFPSVRICTSFLSSHSPTSS